MKLILNYLTCTFEYFSRNCYVFTISWRSEVSIVNQGINLRGWDLGVHFYLVWSGFFSLEKTAQKWVGEKFFKKIRKKMSFLVLAWTDYFSYKNIPICKKENQIKISYDQNLNFFCRWTDGWKLETYHGNTITNLQI